jgi:hypothetical protein
MSEKIRIFAVLYPIEEKSLFHIQFGYFFVLYSAGKWYAWGTKYLSYL